MAESDDTQSQGQPADAEKAQQQPPQLKILGQFIRDMSFENMVARNGTSGNVTPDVQVQVALDAKKRGENRYEVVGKFNITSKEKDGENTLFLLELEYG